MKTKRICVGGLLAALIGWGGGGAAATPVTQSANYSMSIGIPDNNANGVADTELFDFVGADSISSMRVTLNISGGWNGDYYAYLRHGDTGFAVLLNRVGAAAGNPYGYGDGGLNVTLSDEAINGDIHFYRGVQNPNGGSLSGVWQPDGRDVDPDLVTGTEQRTALLSSFAGMDPNGLWTLFVMDDSPGGTGTLTGWGLSITADVVPEPGMAALAALGIGAAMLRSRSSAR